VFDTDPLLCGRYDGHMKIIAFVIQASEIKKILAHLGLPTDTPKSTRREGHHKVICGKTRLLANGA
jgi:hypothetical protein